MPQTLVLYLSIAALPAWMVPVHALSQRALRALKPNISVQVGALVTAAAVNVLYAIWLTGSEILPRDGPDLAAGCLVVAISVNAMAFFYFQLVNVALTSIHMAVLLRVYWAGRLPELELSAQYDKAHMVSERIGRLVQLGQIETAGEFIHLRSRTLIFLSAPVYLWRHLLALAH